MNKTIVIMLDNKLLELNGEILRSREMDYYRYHSFLNGISEVIDKYNDTDNNEVRKVIIGLARDIIQRFVTTYGIKRVPDNVRKIAQELIIEKQWNFN